LASVANCTPKACEKMVQGNIIVPLEEIFLRVEHSELVKKKKKVRDLGRKK
jgi:hypothetical protein